MAEHMNRTSWVELCVSDFEQSIRWFEQTLGFRVIAREANEYAELARGETTIQLAADDAPYWEVERSRLLPPGQRGSGVEIVLLVDNVEAVYRQAQQAQAEIVRPLAEYPWHMRQFWVRHPDGYLIRPAERILAVNLASYRRQIADAFDRDEPQIAEELFTIKQTADTLAQQGSFLEAATIYETLITEIFEQAHLYRDDDGYEYDDYYEEESYYPEEGEEGLEDLVAECIEGLGRYLANKRTDRVAREKCIEALFEIYQQDLQATENHGFFSMIADELTQYTTSLERQTIAERINTILTDPEEEMPGLRRQAYGRFLLELEQEMLDDETYLRICRENGLISKLVDRLLTLGRFEEAEKETQQVDDSSFLSVLDLFMQQGQDARAEHLVKTRLQDKPEVRLLEWLQKYYHDKGKRVAELEVAITLFRTQQTLRRYYELRDLARGLDRWESLRQELLAFLAEVKNTPFLIQIALDEGDIDRALQLLKGMASKDIYGYTYNVGYGYYAFGDIARDVALAAEESRPREAIELYQQRAERLIAQRGRQNYQQASTFLVKVRTLYEKINEQEAWASYIAALREKHRSLRALKEELEGAGL